MPKKVNKLKFLKVKNGILEGKSYKQAMLDAGYKLNTAHHSSQESVVKCCLKEIERELKVEQITPQFVIQRLHEDRIMALAKGDMATATRVDELLGKYIALFTDKQQSSVSIEFTSSEQSEVDIIRNRLSLANPN
jgi:hypothetical protein